MPKVEAKRCAYTWSVKDRPGARYVLYHAQCRRPTRDPSGKCWQHRGSSGRYDERVSRA